MHTSTPSLVLLAAVGCAAMIEYMVIMPSMWGYLQSFPQPGNELFLGYCVAGYSISRTVFLPFIDMWALARSYREVVCLTLLVNAIGNIVYATAVTKEAVLLGRFIAGMGAANMSVVASYASRCAHPVGFTAIVTSAAASRLGAAVMGPVLNVLLKNWKTTVYGITVDPMTSPGFLSAGLYLGLGVCILTVLEEPKKPRPPPSVNPTRDATRLRRSMERQAASPYPSQRSLSVGYQIGVLLRPPVLAMMTIGLLTNVAMSISEVVLTPVTSIFGYGAVENSLLYSAMSILFVGALYPASKLARFIKSDRAALLLGGILSTIAAVIMYVLYTPMDEHGAHPHVPVLQFLLPIGALLLTTGPAVAVTPPLFSRLVEGSRPFYATVSTVFVNIGGIFGPIWGGWALRHQKHDALKWSSTGVLASSGLVLLLVAAVFPTLGAQHRAPVSARGPERTQATPNRPSDSLDFPVDFTKPLIV